MFNVGGLKNIGAAQLTPDMVGFGKRLEHVFAAGHDFALDELARGEKLGVGHAASFRATNVMLKRPPLDETSNLSQSEWSHMSISRESDLRYALAYSA